MKIVQQQADDKYNYTGSFGRGYIVKEGLDGVVRAAVPTLKQAEDAQAELHAKNPDKKYVIEEAGYTDLIDKTFYA